jgi:hypothetical protein
MVTYIHCHIRQRYNNFKNRFIGLEYLLAELEPEFVTLLSQNLGQYWVSCGEINRY